MNTNSSIWYERYKPQNIDDLILPNEMKIFLKESIKSNQLPNLGFWSELPGLGKSSTANAIIKEANGAALWINASLEKGIDTLRGKIQTFVSQSSVDDRRKFVVLDECLEENERVIILKNGREKFVALKDLQMGKVYDCLSMNLETHRVEKDTCEVISDKEDDIYEVELEDGRKILVTSNHPFIVMENGKMISKSIDDGLSELDNVVCRDEYDLPPSN